MSSKKIYTDKNGKEFTLREGYVNRENDKPQKVFVGMDPVLNCKGEQVTNPIVEYEFLSNTDLTVNNVCQAKYPFLVFGSEFTGAEIQSLPTPFSNNIDAMIGSNQATALLLENNHIFANDKIEDMKNDLSFANLDTLANSLYDQCLDSICQNIIALYNNNLRIILKAYLFDKNSDDQLNMVQDTHQMKYKITGSVNHNSTFGNPASPSSLVRIDFRNAKINFRDTEESFLVMMTVMNQINHNISSLYYDLINRISNSNLVDFMKLAENKLGNTNIDPSYLYSAGIDIVNEIANMECGILSNVVEVNFMNMHGQFQRMLEQFGNPEVNF